MKKMIRVAGSIGLLSALALGSLTFRARADLEVSTAVQVHARADFEAPLAAHGTWIEVGSYGRCWRPAGIAVAWHPYCFGYWVWTDCGWYWASDEPWAWACYHYGEWVYDPAIGWVWVPGIEWAPAWVCWRMGGGYVGWAPCGFHAVVVAPAAFVFVDVHHFHEPVRPASVIVNNTTIINRTTEVRAVRSESRNIGGGGVQRVMVNDGPNPQTLQQATGRKVSPVPIREAVRQTPVPPQVARRANTPATPAKPAPPREATPPAQPQPHPPADVKPAPAPQPPPKDGERRDVPGQNPESPDPHTVPGQPAPHPPGVPPKRPPPPRHDEGRPHQGEKEHSER